jgi:hypothetical protein
MAINESYIQLHDLAKRYHKARTDRLAIEQALKVMKEDEHLLEQELWTMMESMRIPSVKLEEIGTVSRQLKRNPIVIDFPTFREWCIVSGNHDFLRQEEKRAELREYVLTGLKEGRDDYIPPGVELITDKIISIRRGRNGDE